MGRDRRAPGVPARAVNPIPFLVAVALGQHGGDQRSEQARRDQPCTTRQKYGTADYWLARFDREGMSELTAQMQSGELLASAATIAAGFRKPAWSQPQVTALQRQQDVRQRATAEERAAFRAWIGDAGGV